VVWARTLVERLETMVPGTTMKIGLPPALAEDDLKERVQRFHNALVGSRRRVLGRRRAAHRAAAWWHSELPA
jgi:hypothetical protein